MPGESAPLPGGAAASDAAAGDAAAGQRRCRARVRRRLLPYCYNHKPPAMTTAARFQRELAAAFVLARDKVAPGENMPPLVERPRIRAHGDFACNLALILAKRRRENPLVLAERLRAEFIPPDFVDKIEIAPPGFINITIKRAAKCAVAREILEDPAYGAGEPKREKILLEFVSVNPTGPLHTGHARGAAYGASLAGILQFAGYPVAREYYVNDAGRQMDILALSLWIRYLQAGDKTGGDDGKGDSGGGALRAAESPPFTSPPQAGGTEGRPRGDGGGGGNNCEDEKNGGGVGMPAGCYRGGYLKDLAAQLRRQHGARFVREVSADELKADKEEDLDAVIKTARAKLGDDDYRLLRDFGEAEILRDIRDDLAAFRVSFDRWFSEKSLFAEGKIKAAMDDFAAAGHLYEKDGALWFRAAAFGDEKDRVVRRENGEYTYFAADIAYHKDKLARGFDILINVFGADHHGYAPRLKAIVAALGADPKRLEVRLIQLASLLRAGKPVKMSTRAGEFVTLRALREEIGSDAARYFFVSRRLERRLEFDLELAKSRSADNPVFYIQYAHARACALARKGEVVNLQTLADEMKPSALRRNDEAALAAALSDFGEVIAAAAAERAPHQLARYLSDLAGHFHAWYARAPILSAAAAQRAARLALALACRAVIARGLGLLGLSAPETM